MVFDLPRAQRTSYQELVRRPGERAFSVSGSVACNALPTNTTEAKTIKRLLKTYFLTLMLRFHHRVTVIDSVKRYWMIFVCFLT